MEEQLKKLFGLNNGKRIYNISEEEVSQDDYQYAQVLMGVLFSPTGLANTLGPTWNMIHDPRYPDLEKVFIKAHPSRFGGDATTGINHQQKDGTFNTDNLAQIAEILGEGRFFLKVLKSKEIIKLTQSMYADRSFRVNPKSDTPGLDLFLPYTPVLVGQIREALSKVEDLVISPVSTDDEVVETALVCLPEFRSFGVLSPSERENILSSLNKAGKYRASVAIVSWSDAELWSFIWEYCPNYFTRTGKPNERAKDLFNLIRADMLGLIEDYAEEANVQEVVLLNDIHTLYEPVIHDTIDEDGRPNPPSTVSMEVENLDRALDYRAQITVTVARLIQGLGIDLSLILGGGGITDLERENILRLALSFKYPDQRPDITTAVYGYLLGIKMSGQSLADREALQIMTLKDQSQKHMADLKNGVIQPISRHTEEVVQEVFNPENAFGRDVLFTNLCMSDDRAEILNHKLHELEKLRVKLVKDEGTSLDELSLVNAAIGVLTPIRDPGFVLTDEISDNLIAQVEEIIPTATPEMKVYEGHLPGDPLYTTEAVVEDPASPAKPMSREACPKCRQIETPDFVIDLVPGSVAADWQQHKNGGGWVFKTAQVDESVFLGADAIVFDNAWVSGNTQVSGTAQVYGNALVCDNAQIYGNARVYGNSHVSGNARVSGDARVHGDAMVGGNARISGNAWRCSGHW